jgi:maleate isomerase
MEKNDFMRIGLLVPSSNTMLEPDFYKNVSENITIHTARMFLEKTTVEGESRMLDEYLTPAARSLATANPNVIVFGCTSAGALRGNSYDNELVSSLASLTGIHCISVIKSVREALSNYNAKNIVVVTPYVDELNDRIRLSLEEDGVKVQNISGLGISENFKIAKVSKKEIIDLALKSVENLSPDLLFLSCTNFPAMSILKELRERFDFPVISSNQVALDAALSFLDYGE